MIKKKKKAYQFYTMAFTYGRHRWKENVSQWANL